MSADYIRALGEERESYVRRELPDRIAQVDAELARLGAVKAEPVTETVDAPTPTRRSARKS